MEECFSCKRHSSQGGNCSGYDVKNCLLFEKEPRGKVKQARVRIVIELSTLLSHGYNPIRKYGRVTFVDRRTEFEAIVREILEIDFIENTILLEIDYHENDWLPRSEKKSNLHIVK